MRLQLAKCHSGRQITWCGTEPQKKPSCTLHYCPSPSWCAITDINQHKLRRQLICNSLNKASHARFRHQNRNCIQQQWLFSIRDKGHCCKFLSRKIKHWSKFSPSHINWSSFWLFIRNARKIRIYRRFFFCGCFASIISVLEKLR